MTPRYARILFFFAAALSFGALRAQTQPAQPAAAAATPAADAAKPDDDQMLQKLLLPDADIDTVLNTLEMLTGRTVLRPASLPTATYNLKITRPIPKSEAILAIETVLGLNQVGVAPQGDKFLVITPITLTRTSAPEMITGSAFDQPASGKPATKIFQLEFLRVQEFAGMIQQILNPNFGGVVQFANANAFLVTDTVANLQRIELLMQQVDKPVMSSMTPKFYPLSNAKAADVVSKIRTILGNALQQQIGQATTYSADDRTNQVILVTDPRQYPFFDELIAKLDTKSNPNTRTEVISLKHADAKEVATLLTQLVNGQTTATQKTNAQSLRPGQAGSLPITPTVPGAPTPPGAAPAVNTAAVPGVDALLGSGSNEFSQLLTIFPDTRSNAVVVFGTADDIRLITGVIDKLDIILAQVRIEVVLAEVTLDDNHTSGISQLGFTVAGDRLTGFSGAESSVTISDGTVTRRGGTTTVTGPFDLAATLAIKTTPRETNTAILSVPAITTTHNKEAKFFFGETRPTVTGSTATPTAATTTTGFSTNSQITQQEIGTTITVKPLIGNDGSVQLDIKMDITEVTGTVQIDNNAQYIIGKRTTNSFITAKTGEILYLSGMQKKKDSRSTSRLGPIPILGDLFGSRNKDNQRTELIFFFRPTVLTNTPADNSAALDRIKDLEQRDAVMKTVDPTYQPPPKQGFFNKLNGK